MPSLLGAVVIAANSVAASRSFQTMVTNSDIVAAIRITETVPPRITRGMQVFTRLIASHVEALCAVFPTVDPDELVMVLSLYVYGIRMLRMQ